MKPLLSLCLAIFIHNVSATELRFDSIDCFQKTNTPMQSKILITNQSNSFFSVEVMGGYPAWNANLPHTCVDSKFDGADFDSTTHSIKGYAIFSDPWLYVIVPGRAGVMVNGTYIKSTYDTPHTWVFTLTEQGFVLVRDEVLGSAQNPSESGFTVYKSLSPQVIYKIVDDAGLKPILQ